MPLGQDEGEDADVAIEDDSDEPNAVATLAIRLRGSPRRASTPTSQTPDEPHENPARLEVASTATGRHADRAQLLSTLKSTVTPEDSLPTGSSSTSPVCRICLDPYEDPTVSTGCWHTCCKWCWLRCLGSTKLCPICKRITVPSDLRQIYL